MVVARRIFLNIDIITSFLNDRDRGAGGQWRLHPGLPNPAKLPELQLKFDDQSIILDRWIALRISFNKKFLKPAAI